MTENRRRLPPKFLTLFHCIICGKWECFDADPNRPSPTLTTPPRRLPISLEEATAMILAGSSRINSLCPECVSSGRYSNTVEETPHD